MLCQIRLTEIGIRAASASDADAITAGHEQLSILASFQRYVNGLNVLCGQSPSLLQQYCISVPSESLVVMQLLLHRPFSKRRETFLNTEMGSSSEVDILEMATAVLERSQHKRSLKAYQQWAWFSWIKWYALAVVLVELCSRSDLDRATERAWDAANLSYQDYAQVVADTRTGLSWKPIAKLMRRASAFRADVISHKQTPSNGQSAAQNVLLSATSRYPESMLTENALHSVLVAPAASHSGVWSAEAGTWTTRGDGDISQQQWEALIDDIYEGSDFMDLQGPWSHD
ncbi:hypothetical protein Slin15195_G028040 [Septoria linicola]|uniref:Uncharacterized protein n=1 Tax=Septoria linicola TaxID=215465 RepID=A0A9Q9EG00_9PEZI|nr:hypothetical protein Slin14017_G027090 [Septoria linicola]USW49485.1 hypothetical protein Slin15195_G028040 [Septoria linicola]